MQKTDWDSYYKQPYKTALFTRRITGNLLVKYIQKHLNSEKISIVEHFTEEETKTAILNHFHYVKDNGIVIIGFPTPTFLYKAIRTCAEILNMWIFHDERPITLNEAHNILKNKEII